MGTHTHTEEDLLEHFGNVLIALEEMKAGMFSAKLETDHPPTSPLGALYQGINEMIEALEREQRRNRKYHSELEDKLSMIEHQRSSIRELSTPVIEIWEGVLCLPVVGTMDPDRSAEIAASLLPAVVERRARCVLVDLTGIEQMDADAVDTLLRVTQSVRLLGASCRLTGLNPAVARAIVELGIELSDLRTYRSLRTALVDYLDGRDEREAEE